MLFVFLCGVYFDADLPDVFGPFDSKERAEFAMAEHAKEASMPHDGQPCCFGEVPIQNHVVRPLHHYATHFPI